MSGDSYSAQLNVQKNVGEPHSQTIQSRSLLRINQYYFVPRIDSNIVVRFDSRTKSELLTSLSSADTVVSRNLLVFNTL